MLKAGKKVNFNRMVKFGFYRVSKKQNFEAIADKKQGKKSCCNKAKTLKQKPSPKDIKNIHTKPTKPHNSSKKHDREVLDFIHLIPLILAIFK